MNLHLIVIIPLVAVAMIGTIINPVVGLYYLVVDSWMIGKLADFAASLPYFSVNKVIVVLAISSLALHTAIGNCRVHRSLLLSGSALFLYLFLGYLLWSGRYLMGRIDGEILNNLAFFAVILAVLGYKTEHRLRWVVLAILVTSATIIVKITVQRVLDAGTMLADVSDGGRIQPGFHVLLCIPFVIATISTSTTRTVRLFAKALLAAGILFVFAQLSRTLVAALVILGGFYLVRGYIKLKIAVLVIPAVVVGLAYGISTDYGRRLLRLPNVTSLTDEANVGAFTSGRSVLYPIAWQAFLRNPIIGAGYDSFRRPKESEYFRVVPPRARSALHSAWLQVLSETGIIGALSYLCLYAQASMNFRLVTRRKSLNGIYYRYADAIFASMLLFFLGGFFDNFGFDYRIFYLVFAMSAVLAFEARKAGPELKMPLFVQGGEIADALSSKGWRLFNA